MKISIHYKLLAAMFCATFAVVAYMALVIQWSFDRGFLEYVNLEEQKEVERWAQLLEIYYLEHQSWETLIEQPYLMVRYHALAMPKGPRRDKLLEMVEKKEFPRWMFDSKDFDSKRTRHPIERTILIDSEENIIFGRKQGDILPSMAPINYQQKVVGRIGIYPLKRLRENHQLLFVKQQKYVKLLVVVAAVFIIIGISLPLAYHLTRPIRRLSEATRQLKSGDYSTRVKSDANDELGRLSKDINSLAQTLEENEIQRKLWVSDIAHELRTPLTGLQGEIEALQDGIREPNSETYARLHRSVKRLSRLVEDLYDLSRYDLGTLSIVPERIDISKLVANETTAHLFEAEKMGITLEMKPFSEPDSIHIQGDRQRLQQLVGNLLTNSIRYTDKGGTVTIAVTESSETVQLDIEDTAPGVPDEALPRLFNRLYRVDQSRSRSLGGSGLGLAISQQIVLAHNGSITAKHSSHGGLWIEIILPKDQDAL